MSEIRRGIQALKRRGKIYTLEELLPERTTAEHEACSPTASEFPKRWRHS